MTTYVDASALLKRYVDEPDRDRAEQFLAADPVLATGRHTIVEIRRNLARLLDGRDLERARSMFLADVGRFRASSSSTAARWSWRRLPPSSPVRALLMRCTSDRLSAWGRRHRY